MKRLNLAFTTFLLATAAGAQEPPNIVLLFADDLGYGAISAYGGASIPTPNIDSLGEDGVRFVSGYMTAPVCNPSRNGLITGRYQQRWGKELNSQTVPPIGAARGTLGLHHQTIGDALQSAGYTNAAIGKWQLGMRRLLHPLDRGFDYFYGMPSGMNYIDPSWPGAHALEMKPEGGANPDRIVAMFKGREQDELKEYQTTQLAREGVEFIERNQDRPFFLYLAFYAVHAPMQVMDEHYQRFPGLRRPVPSRVRRHGQRTGRCRRHGPRQARGARPRRQHPGHLHRRQRRDGDPGHRADPQQPTDRPQAQPVRGRHPGALPDALPPAAFPRARSTSPRSARSTSSPPRRAWREYRT